MIPTPTTMRASVVIRPTSSKLYLTVAGQGAAASMDERAWTHVPVTTPTQVKTKETPSSKLGVGSTGSGWTRTSAIATRRTASGAEKVSERAKKI